MHEQKFSGVVDLFVILKLVGCLFFLCKIINYPSKQNYLLFGLFGALAFLTKSGLSVVPFLILIYVSAKLGIKKTLCMLLYSALFTFILLLPQYFLLLKLFPNEFTYEQAQYLEQVLKSVEGWDRPLDYYLSF